MLSACSHIYKDIHIHIHTVPFSVFFSELWSLINGDSKVLLVHNHPHDSRKIDRRRLSTNP